MRNITFELSDGSTIYKDYLNNSSIPCVFHNFLNQTDIIRDIAYYAKHRSGKGISQSIQV